MKRVVDAQWDCSGCRYEDESEHHIMLSLFNVLHDQLPEHPGSERAVAVFAMARARERGRPYAPDFADR